MDTREAISSMRKTTFALSVAAGLLLLAAAALALVGSGAVTAAAWLLTVAAVVLALLAIGGGLSQERQRRIETGDPDLFLQCNLSRSEEALRDGAVPAWSRARRWLARRVVGHTMLVGDEVQVKSLAAIRATLDDQGCLDALPFMDEMAGFCGQPARIYRIVDKIYDYGRSRLMRGLDDSVLLVGLRCDGAAHAGCEAACYLIWKTAWLETSSARRSGAGAGGPLSPVATMPSALATERLSCQYTCLTSASRPLGAIGWRRFLAPLVVGNVSAAAALVALLTQAFNAVQGRRGGATYPSRPAHGDDKAARGEPVQAGDWVRVRTPGEIARTLDKNSKNRGLWFDRDMLKHCGQAYRVRGRVTRIIDVKTESMIPMKTPCIVLEGVHYSGEFQGFGEQHDYLYFREAWLTPIAPPPR